LDSLGDASGDAMGDWQTQNASMDFQRIKKQFQSQWDAMWLPVCRKMNCDHTNFWDIILSSYGQTMALMQTGPRAFAKVKAEIRNRAAFLSWASFLMIHQNCSTSSYFIVHAILDS
jgi:hypothetical protein